VALWQKCVKQELYVQDNDCKVCYILFNTHYYSSCHIDVEHKQDCQCIYKCNVEAQSHNHWCHGKAIIIT